MEPKKRWDGYVSFLYLEPGIDYKEFELSPQIGRVERFVYPLSDADDERAERYARSGFRPAPKKRAPARGPR
jgi:membrane dipeptidase